MAPTVGRPRLRRHKYTGGHCKVKAKGLAQRAHFGVEKDTGLSYNESCFRVV